MHGRTEVEKYVRALIALDALYKPLSSLGDKGKRRAEKSAKGIVSLLKEGEEKGERIFARVEKSEEERARTLREGIDEFKKQYKEQGEILEEDVVYKKDSTTVPNWVKSMDNGKKGPWESPIYIAFSQDGLTFTDEKLLAKIRGYISDKIGIKVDKINF